MQTLRKTTSQKYHEKCQNPEVFRRLAIVRVVDLDDDVRAVLPRSLNAQLRLLNHETQHQIKSANSRVKILELSKQADLLKRDCPPSCSIDVSRIGMRGRPGELMNPFWIKMGFIRNAMRKRGRLRRVHRIWREMLRYCRRKRRQLGLEDETFWSFMQRTADSQ